MTLETHTRHRCKPVLAVAQAQANFGMAATVESISRERLQRKLELGEELVLVDALSPMSYARSHLPGAINMPPEWVDEWAPRRIPDRNTDIVVYCADADCDSSVIVAERLQELGYLSVRHYAGGKRGWVDAGLALD